MAVLLIADHDGQSLRDTTLKALTAAQALGGDVDVLVAGQGAQAAADAAAKAAGVRKVLLVESEALGHGVAEAVADAVVPLAAGYDAVLAPSTASGKNFMPRIAALLDVSPISDVIEVVDAKTFTRPIYAGNALETIRTADPKVVATIRPTAFKAAAAEGGSASVENAGAGEAHAAEAKFVSEEVVKSDRPELGAAKIIVSGGRALGSAEEFHKMLEPLADQLGAAVGASRAAVDAG
ncbi:MAG: electron transfer flavoprotein subunit alpha/FixB family protein, partial [Caulobacteraceae bacterium]|nr:electron transfer flavoprotein subunit alpha/FixB family protein [Caulobacter sp.]